MEERREAFIVNSVQKWLGNPLTRSLLRFVAGERKGGGSRLDLAIRRYVGERVDGGVRDLFSSLLVGMVLNRGSHLFGYPQEKLRELLKDPVMRRGMVNVLEGIAKYGVRRPFVTASPFLVVWNYTNACNLRCLHCYQNAGASGGNELTTEEAKEAMDELMASGVVAVAFSGGEPLLRKDLLEVAGRGKEGGLFLSVATNGTLLTREKCGEMKGIFDYVEVSLDGFEETHDRFRGIPGIWKKTCEGIRNAVEAGLDTCVAITATRWNLKEIPSLIDFVKEELGAQRVMVFNYVPTGRGKEMVEEDLTPEERWELLRHLYERMVGTGFFCLSTAPQLSVVSLQMAEGKGEWGLVPTHFASEETLKALRGRTRSLADFLGGCGAGRLYCGLQPDGEVVPCVFMPIPLGNLREKRLKEIWGSSEVLWKLRDRDSLKGCGGCQYRYVCGGCRARAYGYFGDVQAPDPGCPYNREHWERLRALGAKA